MFVYRVEDVEGRGPFYGNLINQYDIGLLKIAKERTCGPENEYLWNIRNLVNQAQLQGLSHEIFFDDRHLFGCLSLEQLFIWFPSITGCQAMAEVGGRLVAYSVPDEKVLVDRSCAAFDPEDAIRAWEMPVSELPALVAASLNANAGAEPATQP